VQKVCRGKGFTLLCRLQSLGVPSLSSHGGDLNTTCAFGRRTHHEGPLSFQRSSVPERLVNLVGMPQTDTSNMFQRKGGHVDTKKSSHVGLHHTDPLFWAWSFQSVHPDVYPKVSGDSIDVLSAVTSVLGLYWLVGIRRAHVRKHWAYTDSKRGGSARRVSFQTTMHLVRAGAPMRSISHMSGSFPTLYTWNCHCLSVLCMLANWLSAANAQRK